METFKIVRDVWKDHGNWVGWDYDDCDSDIVVATEQQVVAYVKQLNDVQINRVKDNLHSEVVKLTSAVALTKTEIEQLEQVSKQSLLMQAACAETLSLKNRFIDKISREIERAGQKIEFINDGNPYKSFYGQPIVEEKYQYEQIFPRKIIEVDGKLELERM